MNFHEVRRTSYREAGTKMHVRPQSAQKYNIVWGQSRKHNMGQKQKIQDGPQCGGKCWKCWRATRCGAAQVWMIEKFSSNNRDYKELLIYSHFKMVTKSTQLSSVVVRSTRPHVGMSGKSLTSALSWGGHI